MKIDIAIHSSNSNPMYLDFWPSVSRVWKTKMGITPVLLYIDGDYETARISEDYGIVIRIKPLNNIPIYVQCQSVRYWYATQIGNSVGIISDIDMYPLSNFYFGIQLQNISDNMYVHLNPCMGTYGQIPACYHVAKGITFAKVLGYCDFSNYIDSIIKFSQTNNTAHGDMTYWFADERYSTMLINQYPDKAIFNFIPRDGGQNGHRIDRPNWVYDLNNVSKGSYYDAHSIRPFTKHRTEIETIIDRVPNI